MSNEQSIRGDDGRIRIWVNSGAKMSRGKYAAAAVHAVLKAAGVHPDVPVVVLGGQRDHIEKMQTVIHDAGRTEVEPGTATAGTDYVFDLASPVIRRIQAEALREAADSIERRRNEPGLVKLDVQCAGYYTGIRSGMESSVKALRSEADRIERGETA